MAMCCAARRPKAINMKRRDFLLGASAVGLTSSALFKAAIAPAFAQPAPAGARITRAAIFPAIGFSRVGNSDEWFLAPEVPGLLNEPAGGFKQSPSQVKKQVQRFRVYGFDDQGRVVRELGPADNVRWTVHVANSKAAWYGFSNAMDRGDITPGIPGAQRNNFIAPDKREEMLIINPGPVQISGVSTNAGGNDDKYKMAGQFWKKLPVSLGHLRTDDAGRLLVFPAGGV